MCGPNRLRADELVGRRAGRERDTDVGGTWSWEAGQVLVWCRRCGGGGSHWQPKWHQSGGQTFIEPGQVAVTFLEAISAHACTCLYLCSRASTAAGMGHFSGPVWSLGPVCSDDCGSRLNIKGTSRQSTGTQTLLTWGRYRASWQYIVCSKGGKQGGRRGPSRYHVCKSLRPASTFRATEPDAQAACALSVGSNEHLMVQTMTVLNRARARRKTPSWKGGRSLL